MVLLRLAVLTAFLLASIRVAFADASCPLGIDADFPVSYADGDIPVITVQINGRNARMMVDTGSSMSFISPGAYTRLQLGQTDKPPGYLSTGLGGTRPISAFAMADITFGAVKVKDQVVAIFAKSTPDELGPNAIDGIMGYDILQYFDIGLDLGHHRITLYSPQHCAVTETPWQGNYAPTTFTRPQAGSPVIPETIDGQNFNVVIDTGAYRSLIMQASLTRNHVTPESIPPAQGTGTGMAGLKFQIQKAQFATLDIGAEEFDNAWLILDTKKQAEFNEFADGLVGEDYLSSHRVFIDNMDNTAYLGVSGQ